MSPAKSGNAAKSQARYDDGPWLSWPERDRAERAIRFIETYCRAPKGYGYGKPLKLAEFQKAWLREILSDDVSAAILTVPRGQGKSTLLAALAVWATFDESSSGQPQVPVVATTVGQAMKSVYNVIIDMIRAEPELADRCIIYTGMANARIEVHSTGGTCFPIANKVDTLQGLDPSLAIMDEIGFQPLESWNSLLLASAKRDNSLVVGIGTPGYDRENALWEMRSAWAAGRVIPGFIFQEYAAPEGCDHRDEDMWRIANPALAEGFMNIKALRTNMELTPEAHFRIFHLCQWVDGTDAWLGQDGRKVWEALADPAFKLALGAPTWVGLDVGIKRDSTAVVVGQRRDDGRLHYACRVFMPRADEAIDLTAIMQYLRDLDQQYELQEVAYDPRLFEVPAGMLLDEGLPMTEMPQSLERMTPAFGALFEVIKRGEITHDGTQAFTTQVLNGMPRYNERGFTLMKASSRGKIDAAYALAMCHDRAQHLPKPRRALIFL